MSEIRNQRLNLELICKAFQLKDRIIPKLEHANTQYGIASECVCVCVCNLRIIIMNRSRELLTHIYLPHFAAEAENNLRMENKKKCKENTTQQKNNKKEGNHRGEGEVI